MMNYSLMVKRSKYLMVRTLPHTLSLSVWLFGCDMIFDWAEQEAQVAGCVRRLKQSGIWAEEEAIERRDMGSRPPMQTFSSNVYLLRSDWFHGPAIAV